MGTRLKRSDSVCFGVTDITHLDGLGDQRADEVHEAQVFVAVGDQRSSGQRHAGFLRETTTTTTHEHTVHFTDIFM